MDIYCGSKRSAIMARVRSSGNRSTEMRFAKMLRVGRISGWRRGRRLPGKPDFVFAAERIAVFIDGCFWHQCPLKGHSTLPVSNAEFWRIKLQRNVQRDREVTRILESAGWRVFRVWEHSLESASPDVLNSLKRMLAKRARNATNAGRKRTKTSLIAIGWRGQVNEKSELGRKPQSKHGSRAVR
jgi:DNA mismatch endonuclease (patch repair protein)